MWVDHRDVMDEAKIRANETLKANIAAGKSKIGTEEWKQKISKTVSQRYLEGGIQWSKGEHVSTKTGRRCYYRSSYELIHMKRLDEDTSVVDWRHEPFWLKYEFEGRTRRYLPDFVVTFSDGRREIQEVGVKAIKESLKNEAKRAAAERWASEHDGASYCLLTEECFI